MSLDERIITVQAGATRKRTSTLPKMVLSELKMAAGARRSERDIAVKIIRWWLWRRRSRLGLRLSKESDLVGEASSIVSLTGQQIAVYVTAQADTAEQGSGECQIEVVEQEKGMYKATLAGPQTSRLTPSLARACSMNIPQSCLLPLIKSWRLTDRAGGVHDGKIIVRTNPYGETTPIDESFRSRLKPVPGVKTELYFPDTHPFVEQSSEAFPKVVVNLNCHRSTATFSQSDGMWWVVLRIHVARWADFDKSPRQITPGMETKFAGVTDKIYRRKRRLTNLSQNWMNIGHGNRRTGGITEWIKLGLLERE